MNGESCLCISTIIYTQTAEIANASHQGRTHSLHFSSPHRPAVKYEASSQEDGAPSENLFFKDAQFFFLFQDKENVCVMSIETNKIQQLQQSAMFYGYGTKQRERKCIERRHLLCKV